MSPSERFFVQIVSRFTSPRHEHVHFSATYGGLFGYRPGQVDFSLSSVGYLIKHYVGALKLPITH